MARQQGMIQVRGKVGNVIGYSRNGKNHLRAPAKTVRRTKASELSAIEFGSGTKGASLFRHAFPGMFTYFKDMREFNLLASRLRAIIRSGDESKKGSRQVEDGQIGWLRGFRFNSHSSLLKLTNLRPQVVIVADGGVVVTLPPVKDPFLGPPPSYQAVVRLAAASLDFTERSFTSAEAKDLVLDAKAIAFHGGSVRLQLPAGGLIAVTMSVFFTMPCPERGSVVLRNRKHVAAEILEVGLIRDGGVETTYEGYVQEFGDEGGFEAKEGEEWEIGKE